MRLEQGSSEENTGSTLFDTHHSKILCDSAPRVIEIKINKGDFIKLKSFCTAKETMNKIKRQPSEREKTIANEIADEGLISRIHKRLIELNIRKTNSPVKKWAQDLNRHLPQEDTQTAKTHMERCSISLLVIFDHYLIAQIKTTVRYHFKPVRMAIIKMSTNNKCWREGSPPTLLFRM